MFSAMVLSQTAAPQAVAENAVRVGTDVFHLCFRCEASLRHLCSPLIRFSLTGMRSLSSQMDLRRTPSLLRKSFNELFFLAAVYFERGVRTLRTSH